MDAMDEIQKINEGGYVIYFDVTNAFSSVPIALLLALFDRLGPPDRFCKLLDNSLRFLRVVKKGDEREGWHSPTSGVKQGCPLSLGFFVLLI